MCSDCGVRPVYGKRRKCARCVDTSTYKKSQGRDVRKGSNARGIAAHKPDKARTKRAKRQGADRMGNQPNVRMSRMGKFNLGKPDDPHKEVAPPQVGDRYKGGIIIEVEE